MIGEALVRPPSPRPWRAEVILGELRSRGDLERERDLARLEAKSLRQALAQALTQLGAARRSCAMLAQALFELEWESEAAADA